MSRNDMFGLVVGVAMALAVLGACGWVMLHQTPVLYDVGNGSLP